MQISGRYTGFGLWFNNDKVIYLGVFETVFIYLVTENKTGIKNSSRLKQNDTK